MEDRMTAEEARRESGPWIMHDTVYDTIDAALELHRQRIRSVGTELQVVHAATRDGLIFPSSTGNPIGLGSLSDDLWRPAIEAAGLQPGRDGVHPHTLRRMGITRMAQVLPIASVMRITGHQSLSMHFQYHRAFEGHLDAAREAMNALGAAGMQPPELSANGGRSGDADGDTDGTASATHEKQDTK